MAKTQEVTLPPLGENVEEAEVLKLLVAEGGAEIVASIVRGVNPRARVERTGTGRTATYDVTIDPAAGPADDHPMTAVARVSHGPSTVFVRRRPVRR